MCANCKDAPNCECESEKCAASAGQPCVECGHGSSVPPRQATAEPTPPGWLAGSFDVILQLHHHHQRSRSLVAQMASGSTWVPPPPYYDELLALSRQLLSEGRHELAVVVAQMASELLVEQILTMLAAQSGVSFPIEIRRAQYVNSNLTNKRVRQFYCSNSGDQIGSAAFWGAYRTHVKRRDGVVHRGQRVSPQETQASFEAVTQLVEHLKRRHGLG